MNTEVAGDILQDRGLAYHWFELVSVNLIDLPFALDPPEDSRPITVHHQLFRDRISTIKQSLNSLEQFVDRDNLHLLRRIQDEIDHLSNMIDPPRGSRFAPIEMTVFQAYLNDIMGNLVKLASETGVFPDQMRALQEGLSQSFLEWAQWLDY